MPDDLLNTYHEAREFRKQPSCRGRLRRSDPNAKAARPARSGRRRPQSDPNRRAPGSDPSSNTNNELAPRVVFESIVTVRGVVRLLTLFVVVLLVLILKMS